MIIQADSFLERDSAVFALVTNVEQAGIDLQVAFEAPQMSEGFAAFLAFEGFDVRMYSKVFLQVGARVEPLPTMLAHVIPRIRILHNFAEWSDFEMFQHRI